MTGNIVSAAIVRKDDVIDALWIDPPTSNTGDIDLPETEFFARYYEPIIRFLDSPGKGVEMADERLVYFPDLGMHIGLHSYIRSALTRRDAESIVAFALRRDEPSQSGTSSAKDTEERAQTFSDGVIIKLDRGW